MTMTSELVPSNSFESINNFQRKRLFQLLADLDSNSSNGKKIIPIRNNPTLWGIYLAQLPKTVPTPSHNSNQNMSINIGIDWSKPISYLLGTPAFTLSPQDENFPDITYTPSYFEGSGISTTKHGSQSSQTQKHSKEFWDCLLNSSNNQSSRRNYGVDTNKQVELRIAAKIAEEGRVLPDTKYLVSLEEIKMLTTENKIPSPFLEIETNLAPEGYIYLSYDSNGNIDFSNPLYPQQNFKLKAEDYKDKGNYNTYLYYLKILKSLSYIQIANFDSIYNNQRKYFALLNWFNLISVFETTSPDEFSYITSGMEQYPHKGFSYSDSKLLYYFLIKFEQTNIYNSQIQLKPLPERKDGNRVTMIQTPEDNKHQDNQEQKSKTIVLTDELSNIELMQFLGNLSSSDFFIKKKEALETFINSTWTHLRNLCQLSSNGFKTLTDETEINNIKKIIQVNSDCEKINISIQTTNDNPEQEILVVSADGMEKVYTKLSVRSLRILMYLVCSTKLLAKNKILTTTDIYELKQKMEKPTYLLVSHNDLRRVISPEYLSRLHISDSNYYYLRLKYSNPNATIQEDEAKRIEIFVQAVNSDNKPDVVIPKSDWLMFQQFLILFKQQLELGQDSIQILMQDLMNIRYPQNENDPITPEKNISQLVNCLIDLGFRIPKLKSEIDLARKKLEDLVLGQDLTASNLSLKSIFDISSKTGPIGELVKRQVLSVVQNKTLSNELIIDELARDIYLTSTLGKITEILQPFIIADQSETGLDKVIQNLTIAFFNQVVDQQCQESGIYKIIQVIEQSASQLNSLINLNPEFEEGILKQAILASIEQQIQ
ncbi:MAG: hypothetical protein OHK0017_07060 [Patescibacteria group bacterium]